MAGDPYTYPGSSTLRNRYGIQDAADLAAREARITAGRLAELAESPLPGRYDLPHLQAFHRRIFGDLYEWAGELRTVDITKTETFAHHAYIDSYLTGELSRLQAENFLRDLPADRFSDRLTHYLSEINAVHPFREGNGRTQRAFVQQLAGDAGYRLDWRGLDPAANIQASREALHGNLAPLRELISDRRHLTPGQGRTLSRDQGFGIGD